MNPQEEQTVWQHTTNTTPTKIWSQTVGVMVQYLQFVVQLGRGVQRHAHPQTQWCPTATCDEPISTRKSHRKNTFAPSLNYTNRSLVLRTLADVDQYNRIYGCRTSKDDFSFTQWKRVADSFDGIETTPSKVECQTRSIYGIPCGTAVWTAAAGVCGTRRWYVYSVCV